MIALSRMLRLVVPGLLLAAFASATYASTPRPDACRTARTGYAPRAAVGTLAYVVTECRGTATTSFGFRQSLRIRRGDCPPVTVAEFSAPGQPDPEGLCHLYGRFRTLAGPLLTSPIQRLGVTPDGATVVFEVTDDLLPYPVGETPPEQEGIWAVRADGSGRRWLAPASRDPTVRCFEPACLTGFNYRTSFAFSPDGRLVAFTDRERDPSGNDAVPLVVLDLVTGVRRRVTHFRPVAPQPGVIEIGPVVFLSNKKLAFGALLDSGGFAAFTINPGEGRRIRKVLRSSGSIEAQQVPPPVAIPGGHVVPVFQVTGGRPVAFSAALPQGATEPSPALVKEAFVLDDRRVLQLTNFGRGDTQAWLTSVGGSRVFFIASADPVGRNPTGNCQLFSVGRFGGAVRQLTDFSQGGPTANGCVGFGQAPGCSLGALPGTQDPETRTLVFDSTCDPLGMNPYGIQIFAMLPNGSGLRQLTQARGLVTEADGTVSVEFVSHWGYSGASRDRQR